MGKARAAVKNWGLRPQRVTLDSDSTPAESWRLGFAACLRGDRQAEAGNGNPAEIAFPLRNAEHRTQSAVRATGEYAGAPDAGR